MTSPWVRRGLLRACLTLGMAAAALPALAGTASLSPAPAHRNIPVSSAMATGGLTSQPIGHYEFCKANAAECGIRPLNTAPAAMTDALWQTLVGVTKAVNAAVKPMNDIDVYGRDEVWAYPDGKGDCEDYAMEKRRRLNAAGISLADLLLTVVKKPDGEGHAVLTVRTTEGDYILDNLNDSVRRWDATGYRFLKRQAVDNTGRWVSIRGGRATAVAAVEAVR